MIRLISPAEVIGMLTTKLFVPPSPDTLVARPRLNIRLQRSLQRPLTVVVAPPGFGKTTVVAAWVADLLASGSAQVAWLALDEADSDPARFWSGVAAALERVEAALGEELGALLGASPPLPPAQLLTPLINRLAARNAPPLLLVLDDYHSIDSTAVHEALAFLVTHLPPGTHLVLTSRSDPPLPLPLLRARGRLVELRAADLRFTPDEAAAFLNEVMGLELTAESVAALEARTEGWIAGLQLAALSMQDVSDRAAFVRTLSGSHSYILDYLVEEVLQRQPAHLRRFLLQTAVLDQLSGSLCDAVIGLAETEPSQRAAVEHPGVMTPERDSSSRVMLAQLERANLFLVPLDTERRWYRYHHLFADVLRARLAEEASNQISTLHRRASAWYAAHAEGATELAGRAIGHALAAHDLTEAARLMSVHADALWERNELVTLRSWLTALPQETLSAHPSLALTLAQVLLVTGSVDAIPPVLALAEEQLSRADMPAGQQRLLHGGVLALRSNVARITERFGESATLAREALRVLPEDEQRGRALATMNVGLAEHMRGDLAGAAGVYAELISHCDVLGDRYLGLVGRCLLGVLLHELGDLDGAVASYEQGRRRAAEQGQILPVGGWALVGLGRVAFSRDDLPAAEQLLVEGLELTTRGNIRDAVALALECLIRLRLTQGDLLSAVELAERFVAESERNQLPLMVRWAHAMQALVALARGDTAAAVRWAGRAQPRPDALFLVDKAAFAVFVRVLLAQGKLAEARTAIAAHRTAATSGGHVEILVELSLLEAEVARRSGDAREAQAARAAAHALAASVGLRRPGEAGTLLGGVLETATEPNLSSSAGAGSPHERSIPAHVRPAVVEPLSQREQEVLQLMAEGLSNQALADRLIISLATVKKHLSNIFGKLQATSRTEAIARARALGLLP
jgi:LuxR family transcriptional regulator, maltose regulon positive regulatory protein